MTYLADTHLLLWAALTPNRLSKAAQTLLRGTSQPVMFSTVSIWETSIKFARGKKDFTLPPAVLRSGLLQAGYEELRISSEHVIAVSGLPAVHKDPFDRLLIAQALVEGITLLTADKILARYPNTLRV